MKYLFILALIIIPTTYSNAASKFKIIGINGTNIYNGTIVNEKDEWDTLITYEGPFLPCRSVNSCDNFEDKITYYLSIMRRDEIIRYLEETKDSWQRCDKKYNNKCKYIGTDFWMGDDAYLYRLSTESLKVNQYKRALTFSKIAATNGYTRAQHFMGISYDPRFKDLPFKKDYSKAIYWYKEAAEQNWPSSLVNLATLYKTGKGVDKNFKIYFSLIQRAAAADYVDAQYLMGDALEQGIGSQTDYASALTWYEKAGNNGDVQSMYHAGVFYTKGRGVAVDHCKAVSWYQKAADEGYAPAQHNLANRYAQGQCVTQDINKAINLYKLAAGQNYEFSKRALKNYTAETYDQEELSEAAGAILYATDRMVKLINSSCGSDIKRSYSYEAIVSEVLSYYYGADKLELEQYLRSSNYQKTLKENNDFIDDFLRTSKTDGLNKDVACGALIANVAITYGFASEKWNKAIKNVTQ